MRAICNPKNLPKAVAAAEEELASLVRDGVTEKELRDAQAGYLRQREIGRTRDASLAGTLAMNLYYGWTMKREADREDAVKRLKVDDIAAALRKHVDPKKLVVVGAGDVPPDAVK
jgi:zinc protease